MTCSSAMIMLRFGVGVGPCYYRIPKPERNEDWYKRRDDYILKPLTKNNQPDAGPFAGQHRVG